MISRSSGHLTPPVTCIIQVGPLHCCSEEICTYVSILDTEFICDFCKKWVQGFVYLQVFVTTLINIGDHYFRQEQNIAFMSATMSRVKFSYNVTSSRASGEPLDNRNHIPARYFWIGRWDRASRWQANKYSLLFLDFAGKPPLGGHHFGTISPT